MRRWLLTLVKGAVSVGLLWLLVTKVDMGDVAARLQMFSAAPLAAALLLIVIQNALVALRWRVVVKALGAEIGFLSAFSTVMIGVFFSQALPSSIGGDAVRIWRGYVAGLPAGTSAISVVLERGAGGITLVLWCLAGLPFLSQLTTDPLHLRSVWLISLLGVFGVIALLLAASLPMPWTRFRVLGAVKALSQAARTVYLSREPGSTIVVISLLAQAIFLLAIQLVFAAVEVRLSWPQIAILLPPVLLFSLLPISIAGWGVREGAMVVALGIVGIEAQDALLASIAFGLALLIVGLPGGIIWLLTRDARKPH